MIFKRLRDIRKDNDISQKDMAKILNLHTTQYAIYERGERNIPIQIFINYAEYFNISIDYLAGVTDTPRKLHHDKPSKVFGLK